MSDQKFDEMIYAYSAGCLDKDDLLEFLEFTESGGKLNERKLGELQNLSSLLPLILEIEMPHPQVRDKFARRLFRLRDEVRVKAKATQRNPVIEIPLEAPEAGEEIPEETVKEEPIPVEIKKEEFKKPEFRKEEFKKSEFRKDDFKKPEFKKEDPKKEEIKKEEPKIEVPSRKPEVSNKKSETFEKKEPVKVPDPKERLIKDDKKSGKEEIVKEDKKGFPEKETYKSKEAVQEKSINKEKVSDKFNYALEEEEEESRGFGKYIIIGIAAIIIIGAIFFMTRGSGSNQQATTQPPVDSAAIKAKQEQIQKLNEQLANIQNGGQTNTQAAANDPEQKKVDELTKQLQALKEEMTKLNQAKTSSPTQVQPTQQVQTQPKNEIPAEQPKDDKPVAAQTQVSAASARNNDNAPAAASEVRRTEEVQTYATFAEEMPSPVGGMPNMLRKVNMPEKAISAGVEGRVFVKAFIDENGNVTRTSVARGLGYGCDEVAEFVVKSTKFVPGKNRGKALKVEMLIPVPFKL